jgi:hypothetical protein
MPQNPRAIGKVVKTLLIDESEVFGLGNKGYLPAAARFGWVYFFHGNFHGS